MLKVINTFLLLLIASYSFAQVSVSIPVQRYIVNRISDNLSVNVMADLGADPHTFAPKPLAVKRLEDSTIYLALGFPFEDTIKSDKVYVGVDSELDPHVWTSPKAMKEIVTNSYNALKKLGLASDSKYQEFMTEIDTYDKKFAALDTVSFLVYHPSLGHFAKDYGMTQYAIEVEGSEPKAKDLQLAIEKARGNGVKIFIAQPNSAAGNVKLVSKELGLAVNYIDILQEDWNDMMNKLYRAFNGE
ncbi:MAG: zinc ABC transporter substrate-binding protein [Deferribacteraceae bacterium]|jgi:zinc transport system substrate-binding protein|nr:zinc ABC transporter substrate-binding protein [Deferribacteraceae bacterium]